MTATDALRRLLDERGVEYRHEDVTEGTLFVVTRDVRIYYILAREKGFKAWSDWLTPEQAVAATLGPTVTGETSDGYHTFNELYHHRAVLFSVIVRDHPDIAWKSKLHSDGTMYDGMFIAGIETPQGQATYHYDIDPYWEMFDCGELERAPEWDGHTPDEAIARIATLGVSDATPARQDVVADVDEIIEHVINANMLSMPYDVYSELFDAVDGLGVEIENLQAENAKLREELADAPKCETCEAMLDCDECLRADDSKRERKRLACENAKLRELMAWMYRLMDESCAVQHPYAPEPIRYDTLLYVYEKLHELGIEVDA